jgi:CPA2 family monovalent cation:H+ antiporter-2
MIHLPAFIEDLGLILAAAGIVTLLFKRFHQPIVLGYIIAGFLVGPHFTFFPTITDNENVKVWAEIGIIFLLFGLGLEFSFKKLARVGNAATLTATVEVLAMATIGYFTGRFFGWSLMDSLFLGGILSISSTTIIIRAFEEAGVKGRGFVSLVFGVLVVEDLIAILILVLLSTISISQSVANSEVIWVIAKLVLFLILCFLAAIFLVPAIFKKLRAQLTSETLLVLSLGLCFLMVILTTKAGFSPALGAFLMGSILAETTEGKRIEGLIDSVKNLFASFSLLFTL